MKSIILSFLFYIIFILQSHQIKSQFIEIQNYLSTFKDSLTIDNPYVIMSIGYMNIYMGNNERGNEIMNYAISKIANPSYEDFHHISVQNTKNGNYDIAILSLEKAYALNNAEISPYYGWVLLYYYRDYERAIYFLNVFDSTTPNFSVDVAVGEDIRYLKGNSIYEIGKI